MKMVGTRRSVGEDLLSSALCRTWPTTLARTRTGRVTHGLTRTDSRDTRAAHRVRQDPNGVNRARIAPVSRLRENRRNSALHGLDHR